MPVGPEPMRQILGVLVMMQNGCKILPTRTTKFWHLELQEFPNSLRFENLPGGRLVRERTSVVGSVLLMQRCLERWDPPQLRLISSTSCGTFKNRLRCRARSFYLGNHRGNQIEFLVSVEITSVDIVFWRMLTSTFWMENDMVVHFYLYFLRPIIFVRASLHRSRSFLKTWGNEEKVDFHSLSNRFAWWAKINQNFIWNITF